MRPRQSGHLEGLVNRQVLRWERLERGRKTERRRSLQQPTITISRSYGAGGRALGDELLRILEIPLYDREIVEEIAQNANIRSHLADSVDERAQSAISRWIGELFDDTRFKESDYLSHLVRVLLTLAHRDQSILIGRGAHAVLRPERTLRVKVIARRELRVARIAARLGASHDDADARVEEVDAARVAFLRRHFGKQAGAVESFDLVVDTSDFDLKRCAMLVASLFRSVTD